MAIKACLDFKTAVRNHLQKTRFPKDSKEICMKYSTTRCGEQWQQTHSPQKLPTFEYKKIEWRTEERLPWRVPMESMEALLCTNNWGGVSDATGSELHTQESNEIFTFNYGTNEVDTRRLYSVLHTGICLTVSKDCRIYPGARCLTGRESDLAPFDCQQKMTSYLFLFVLIHRNSYEQLPMLGYKQKTR